MSTYTNNISYQPVLGEENQVLCYSSAGLQPLWHVTPSCLWLESTALRSTLGKHDESMGWLSGHCASPLTSHTVSEAIWDAEQMSKGHLLKQENQLPKPCS